MSEIPEQNNENTPNETGERTREDSTQEYERGKEETRVPITDTGSIN